MGGAVGRLGTMQMTTSKEAMNQSTVNQSTVLTMILRLGVPVQAVGQPRGKIPLPEFFGLSHGVFIAIAAPVLITVLVLVELCL